MTIDEFNNKLQHYDARCDFEKNKYIVHSVLHDRYIASISENDREFRFNPHVFLIGEKEVKILCFEFAMTEPIYRISKHNLDRILDLLHVKQLLNKHYFPRSRAKHYISKRINKLKVGD